MTTLLGVLALLLSYLGLPADSVTCLDQQNVQFCTATVETSSDDAGLGLSGDVKHISNGF